MNKKKILISIFVIILIGISIYIYIGKDNKQISNNNLHKENTKSDIQKNDNKPRFLYQEKPYKVEPLDVKKMSQELKNLKQQKSNGEDVQSQIYILNQKYQMIKDIAKIQNIPIQKIISLNEQYVKSPDKVFFRDQELINANPDDFEVMNYTYAKDNKNVYANGLLISGADLSSFTTFGKISNYAKDKNNAYYINEIIDGVDVNSFFPMNEDYARDKNNIINYGAILTGADYSTFEVLDFGYAKDKNNAYVYGAVIPDIDYKTFESLSQIYAKDKNNIYAYSAILTGADVDTFQILSPIYAKDKNNVYQYNQIMPDTDPNNFQVPK